LCYKHVTLLSYTSDSNSGSFNIERISVKKKIKILLFTDTLCDLNGVSRFIQDIAKEAIKKEVQLFILTSTAKKDCPQLPNIYNIKPLFKMKMPFYNQLDFVFPSYGEMKKISEKIQPDIIHISTPGMVGFFGRSIAKKSNIPIMGTYHTDFPKFIYNNIPIKWVEQLSIQIMRYFYKNFTALFVRSNEYMKIAQEHTHLAKENIHVLQAGIDTSKFNTHYKNMDIWDDYNIPQNHTKALYVGRLTKEKNFPLLLEYWATYFALSPNKNISLIVVGSGKLDEEKYAPFNVKFLGEKRGEVLSKIYASADLFLFPSTTDTLGQVAMEAMSSGLSVIVSDKGGPQTLIDPNKPAGYVVDTQNKALWLESIHHLISSQTLREEMASNGIATIQNMGIENSFEAFIDKHIEVLLK